MDKRKIAELLNSLDPRSLEELVVDLIRLLKPRFQVRRNVPVSGIEVDVLAEPLDPSGNERPTAFEVKRVPVIGVDLIRSQLRRRNTLKVTMPDLEYVLVSPGGLTHAAREDVLGHDLSIWDSSYLAEKMDPSLAERWFGISTQKLKSNETTSKPIALCNALADISPGNNQAFTYQQWVADTFEYLFMPPLGPVHYDDTDAAGRNRRDVILENWATVGLWADMRTIYSAYQIIVDAKNSASLLGKRSILELAHYLKPYGCGLFGIICCRKGAGPSAIHAVREEWIGGSRLILILSDDLILNMLEQKPTGTPPEEFLRREIGAFRKSL